MKLEVFHLSKCITAGEIASKCTKIAEQVLADRLNKRLHQPSSIF